MWICLHIQTRLPDIFSVNSFQVMKSGLIQMDILMKTYPVRGNMVVLPVSPRFQESV